MDGFNKFLNVLAAIILFASVMFIIYITNNYIRDNKVNTEQKIIIEYKKFDPHDTLNSLAYSGYIHNIDSVNVVIQQQINNFQEKQNLFLESKKDDAFFNKLFTAVIAFVVAIAGFFGFKSVHEIQANTIKEAKDVAEKEAKSIKQEALSEAKSIAAKEAKETAEKEAKISFDKTFNSDYKSAIHKEAYDAANNFLRKEIEKLQNELLTSNGKIEELVIRLNKAGIPEYTIEENIQDEAIAKDNSNMEQNQNTNDAENDAELDPYSDDVK
jgi:hypothetical protein